MVPLLVGLRPNTCIAELLDFPHFIPDVVHWIQKEWPDRHRTGATVEARLCGERKRDYLPCALIALQEQSLVGYVSLVFWAEGAKRDQPHWIDGLYVDPLYRRQGLGLQLLQAAEQRAVSLGITRLLALTEIPALYERAGWSSFPGAKVEQLGDFIMQKRIKS